MVCVSGFFTGVALCICSFLNQTCQERLVDTYIDSIATHVVIGVDQIRENTIQSPIRNAMQSNISKKRMNSYTAKHKIYSQNTSKHKICSQRTGAVTSRAAGKAMSINNMSGTRRGR